MGQTCLALCIYCVCATAMVTQDDPKTKTLVILVSGVKWDEVSDDTLEGFRTMSRQGVRAKFVNPVFPSHPLPNWFSIATGLYPESHGVIISGGGLMDIPEPIWSAAEREGMRTNCGSSAFGCPEIQMDSDVRDTLDESLKKFKEDRVDLVIVRYGLLQVAGIENGPNSSTRRAALESFDAILKELLDNITKAGMDKTINLVVLSDQGLTNCRHLTPVDLEPLSDLIQTQLDRGAVAFVDPVEGLTTKLSEELKDWQSRNPGVRVYRKEHIPKKLHLKKHPKLPYFFVQAKKGFYILPLRRPASNGSDEAGLPVGCQGFDPFEVSDMRTIFLARGPAFRRNYTSEPLSNVDHYNLLCHLLDIAPAPNNGTWDKVDNMLHEDDDEEFEEDTDYEDEDEEEGKTEEDEHDPDAVLPHEEGGKGQASRKSFCVRVLVLVVGVSHLLR